MKQEQKATIGILGGSGFYQFLKGREVSVNTPYGKPSDKISLSEYAGQKVAFLPRHGKKHQLPPHKIPYKANLWAFKNLGVKRIISPCAAGSLQAHVKPGDFVIVDQFVDRTKGREDTYYHGPDTYHVAMAEPYCPELRRLAIESCQKLKISHHRKGTVVVVNGPRYSTKSESRWFSSQGWEVINMTQYPEVVLARELEMCFVNISLITDYDVGIEGREDIKPVVHSEVVRVFAENNKKIKKLISEMVKNMPSERKCLCKESLKYAHA